MSFLTDGNWTLGGSSQPGSRAEQVSERKLGADPNGAIAAGTIACARCDTPMAVGPDQVAVTKALTCPFCTPQRPVWEFLSLDVPTRPTRVGVRLRIRSVG